MELLGGGSHFDELRLCSVGKHGATAAVLLLILWSKVFYTGITCWRWLVADYGDVACWTALAAAWRAVFIPWDTKQSCWPRLPKREFKMPQAALLPFLTGSIHTGIWDSLSSRQAQGNLSPQTLPLRQQLAGAWADTCTVRHCQASWWNHPGSPSSSQPPTLAVLNTTALCHLVILGKRIVPGGISHTSLGKPSLHQDWRAPPVLFPADVTGLVLAGMERSYVPWLSSKRRDHSSVLSGSTAQSGLSLQGANKNWMQSYQEQAGPRISNGRKGLPKAPRLVAALFFWGAEVSSIQNQDLRSAWAVDPVQPGTEK